jgi:hypothetical protein
MRDGTLDGWSDSEQVVARTAFDQAYGRSIDQLVQTIRTKSESLSNAESVWELHDFLSIERHTIEGRFDFRVEGILFVFASLVKDNLLALDELAGLDDEKLAKIAAMSRF